MGTVEDWRRNSGTRSGIEGNGKSLGEGHKRVGKKKEKWMFEERAEK